VRNVQLTHRVKLLRAEEEDSVALHIVPEEIHRHNILVRDNVVIANVQGYLAPLSEAEAMIHIKPYGSAMVSTRPGCEALEVRFDVKTRTGHSKTISWVFTESPDAKRLARERARREATNLLTGVDSSYTIFSNPNIVLTEGLSARVEIVELEYADVVKVSMRGSERVLQLENPHIWKIQKAKTRITFFE